MKTISIMCKMGLLIVAVCFFAGCATTGGTKVSMSYDKYSPSFKAASYSYLKGKKVVLASFQNQAQNTKSWGYNSADNKYMYEGNATLESYYWYCFKKAFRHIGVRVVEYQSDDHYYRHRYWWGAPGTGAHRAPKGISEFQMILTFMTDQEFKFKVLILKNGETKLDKSFTVTMPPAGTDKIPELERRSYRLVDAAFTTVIKDKDFRRVF